MPLDRTVTVLTNQDLGHGNFLLEFEAPEMVAEMRPGQFFMVGVPHSDMLLRRPFSVCGLPGTFSATGSGRMHLLYKVVGSGTGLLATLAPGAPLDVLGPLGRGFSEAAAGQTPVFVAGGIGIAPFPALTQWTSPAAGPPILLYGARSAAELTLLDWFRPRCQSVVVTTDDGSAGEKGFVTAALEQLLRQRPPTSFQVFACGPEPMLKRVAAITKASGVWCELSLEAHMACGFGVCLGCVVPTRTGRWGDGGYERVCVEGPVMRAEQLAW